jgi:sec-independent protein translocase protein TatA
LFTSVLQPTHLIIILIVLLLFLGPKRLPDAGRALGKGLREFRSSISGEEIDDQIAPAPSHPQQEDSPNEQIDSPLTAAPTAELTAATSTPSAGNQQTSDSHH